jgi:hypothetical protein
MTATKLRWVLIGTLVLLLGAFGASAWWVQTILADSVRQTDHAQTDAEVAVSELNQLRNLQKQLIDEKDIAERAKQIAATTEQYRYQDQVISDISGYAARHGIGISAFDFSKATSAKPSEAAGGAKKTPFTITLKGPLSYTTFLRFLQDLEKNLTRIQLTSLTLAPDKDPNNISNPNIGLEVYLKG